MTPRRISVPNVSLSASSSRVRTRDSSWVRVRSSGTATMRVLPCNVNGRAEKTHTFMPGERVSTVAFHAWARSISAAGSTPSLIIGLQGVHMVFHTLCIRGPVSRDLVEKVDYGGDASRVEGPLQAKFHSPSIAIGVSSRRGVSRCRMPISLTGGNSPRTVG